MRENPTSLTKNRMPPAPAIPGEAGWPMTIATTTLSVTWWAIKTLALLGSITAVSIYTVDWQGMIIQPVLQEASRWANQFIDGIDAESVTKYTDSLINELEAQVGHVNNLPHKVSDIRWYFDIAQAVGSLAVGMGSEWWITRKKEFSFTRGLIYSTGTYGAFKAIEHDFYITAAVYGAETVINMDFDWVDIKNRVRKIIKDHMGEHGL
jgi:hypothetical protein